MSLDAWGDTDRPFEDDVTLDEMPMIHLPERKEDWAHEPWLTELADDAARGAAGPRGTWKIHPGIVLVLIAEIRRLRADNTSAYDQLC